MNHQLLLTALITLLVAGVAGSAGAAEADAEGATSDSEQIPVVAPEDEPSYQYPQRREMDGFSLVLHAPQIRSWPEFESFEAIMAIELSTPDGGGPFVGSLSISGSTQVEMEQRVVRVSEHKITDVSFTGTAADKYEDQVKQITTRDHLDFPLDLFLAHVANDVLSDPPPPGFNTEPPPIYVATSPTLLLLINGEPVLSEVAGSDLKVVVNASWPVYQQADGEGAFYLLNETTWLTADSLEGPWQAATSLPDAFSKVPDNDENKALNAAVPLQAAGGPVPDVLYTDVPAELILTEGQPVLVGVEGVDELSFIGNTPSPVFLCEGNWYFLVAGRWFTTDNLEDGPWTYNPELPEAFAQIPEDSPVSAIRASVPGTVESKMAALEALLPTTTTAKVGDGPPVEITYSGEPQFEDIEGTSLQRAANSGFDIIKVGEMYYLCYSAVWYVSSSPQGPWTVATSVPDEIYTIPPSSPAYRVTQVTVSGSDYETVEYSYPSSYSNDTYVVYGTTYYGTGWYYSPYIYGGYYYPYWGSYGHGNWYNPNTGAYGSRSVYYGPYGGYSYTQGYNPSTGRYGYVETAWDGDEWASHGETYNPRTGISTETNRYYDEDKNKSEMDRRVERGDKWMETERNIDWDEGTSETKRETSGGASSEMQRQYEDGTIYSEGTIQGRDGEVYEVEGERTADGASGTISGDDRSAEYNSQREDGTRKTSIDGSEGGSFRSVSDGDDRYFAGESASGDLYAGHNGEVYRKTDDGWEKHGEDGWDSVDPERQRPESTSFSEYQQQREQAGTEMQQRRESGEWEQRQQQLRQQNSGEFGSRQGEFQQRQSAGSYGGGFSQLNRDHSARQMSNRQFQRRSGGFQRGGFQRRGGGLRRR